MPSISSYHHREVLREQAEERQVARDQRTPTQQLEVLRRRGVSVPSESEMKGLDIEVLRERYCREVVRLVQELRDAK